MCFSISYNFLFASRYTSIQISSLISIYPLAISLYFIVFMGQMSLKLVEEVRTWDISVQSVQSLSCVRLFAAPWIAACKASLSITNSRSSLRLTSIDSVMPSSHLILCRTLLLLPPIPPSIRVFCISFSCRWSWSLPLLQCHETLSTVLQALYQI